MKVGLFQYAPEQENIEKSIKKIERMLEFSSKDHDILVFPEMSLTGFTMNSTAFAENGQGECAKFFCNLARKTKKHVFAGLIEKNEEGVFNSLVHFDRNGMLCARYRKIHPFLEEKKHYNASNRILVTKADDARVGLSICYDLRFPELFRLYAKQRVDVIINIANWPIERIEHWRTLLQARAIENQCIMVGINRVGQDEKFTYNGNSAVFGPMGEELLCAPNQEKLFSVSLPLDDVPQVRESLPFLEDMKLI